MDNIESFESSSHKVYHGDCIKVMKAIDDESIDLIFADPPYNIGKFSGSWDSDEEYIEWCKKWIDICVDKLASDGTMYLMNSTQFNPYIDIHVRDKMDILSRVVWHYDSSGRQAKHYFGSLWEPIIHCVKDDSAYTFNSEDIKVDAKTGSERELIDYRKDPPEPYNKTKVPGNVWEFPRVRYQMKEYEDHPAQKPEVLLERIIRASSNPGDVVMDPFAGTFTTCAVADQLDRQSIGIELQEEYVEVGLRRVGITDAYDEAESAESQQVGEQSDNEDSKKCKKTSSAKQLTIEDLE